MLVGQEVVEHLITQVGGVYTDMMDVVPRKLVLVEELLGMHSTQFLPILNILQHISVEHLYMA
jgi:hypothetical protein